MGYCMLLLVWYWLYHLIIMYFGINLLWSFLITGDRTNFLIIFQYQLAVLLAECWTTNQISTEFCIRIIRIFQYNSSWFQCQHALLTPPTTNYQCSVFDNWIFYESINPSPDYFKSCCRRCHSITFYFFYHQEFFSFLNDRRCHGSSHWSA